MTKRWSAMLFLVLALSSAGGEVWAQKLPKPKAKPPETAAAPVAPQSPEQVDAFMGSLTDPQVRRMLSERLKTEARAASTHAAAGATVGGANPIGDAFFAAEAAIDKVFQLIGTVFTDAEGADTNWADVWHHLTEGRGLGHLLTTLLILALIITAGLAAEALLLRWSGGLRDQLLKSVTLGRLGKIGAFFLNLILNAIGVAGYVLVTFLLFVSIFHKAQVGFLIGARLLIITYYLRLILLAARVFMSPRAQHLRLAPLEDADAAFLFRWTRIVTAAACGAAIIASLFNNPGSQGLFLLMNALSGLLVNALLIIMIWQSRRRVARAICPEWEQRGEGERPILARIAGVWHFLAIIYLAVISGFWCVSVLTGGDATLLKLVLSIFIIPLFISLDQWGLKLLEYAAGERREIIDLNAPAETEGGAEEAAAGPMTADAGGPGRSGIRQYLPLIKKMFRTVLVLTLLFAALRMWGIDLPIGRMLTRDILGILFVLIGGLILWEVIKARIDSKIREEMPETDDEHEEGGGSGSRSGTLLTLLRKFVFAVLFVVIALIVLSAMGVNIGPLIAGAGVFGLAIGFGAQTLVKDIISGVFFLVDDTFRLGEYVETGAAKGSVEHISLRSLKLRHPRGMVYTIPFGDMKSVTNFSRDYTIMKLDIRVRYDADLELIRKTVKKVNKTLRKDEAINRVMLDDLKSQGVKEMDDSAMIVRVKFKTLPGEQFVIRREVYRLIQEQFRANGIEFAHRNVTVYMPPAPAGASGGTETGERQRMEAAAGGAAAAAIAQAEAEELAKKPKKTGA